MSCANPLEVSQKGHQLCHITILDGQMYATRVAIDKAETLTRSWGCNAKAKAASSGLLSRGRAISVGTAPPPATFFPTISEWNIPLQPSWHRPIRPEGFLAGLQKDAFHLKTSEARPLLGIPLTVRAFPYFRGSSSSSSLFHWHVYQKMASPCGQTWADGPTRKKKKERKKTGTKFA
ncbi:hypothetical protein ABW19_dt0203040 [Dactylella cylindrospora]|nr:hypothetical protein ABW19_dt0203040 [Dactylella cylindrospora]